MDLSHAIAVPKASAGHVRHFFSAFSRPELQKESRRVSPLSPSKGERRVSPRKLVVIKAASSGEDQFGSGGSNMVDANMIILRKRMFDLKMQEKTPEEYMEWDNKLYPAYHAHVFRAMEWLQFSLINTRPIVAIAVFSLISVGVSSSVLIVWATIFEALAWIMCR